MAKEAVIYVRVSTEEQAKEGRGIQSQERDLRELAESKGIENPQVIRDEGVSGQNLNRGSLQHILNLAQDGKIDRVLVWKLDRLSRNMLDTFWILRSFRESGVKVVTLEDELDYNSPISLLIAAVKAYASEEEVRNLVKRTQGGKREKFLEKKWILPHVPFGYEKQDKWLRAVPEKETIVRAVFAEFIKRGSYAATARAINLRFKDDLGVKLTRAQVKSIVTNPVYAGRPSYGGDVEVEDKTLAVIDEKTFEEAQKAAEKIAIRHSKDEDKYLQDCIKEYGLDYVSRVTRVRPVCKQCGDVMVKSGSKTVRGLRVGKYKCNNCGYQATVPLGVQIAKLEGRKLLSCPYCRVTEKFSVQRTLDPGVFEYTCRECGGSFLSKAIPDKYLRDYPPGSN